MREKYGDDRRSKLVERAAAQAIDETELVASEPVTVVLSRSGWVRAAKGHDIDPRTLSYKTGDEFRAAARGRSTQLAVFLDSTGRAYSLPAHTLPSARGQGEPLSGRLDPPDGATFPGVLIGEPDERWVLASGAGYGFVVKLGELHSRNRAGKAVLKVPEGSSVLRAGAGARGRRGAAGGREHRRPPARVPGGRPAGAAARQGQQDLRHPDQEGASGEEALVAIAAVAPGQTLRVLCGERHMGLTYRELGEYRGERGQRGAVLPAAGGRWTGWKWSDERLVTGIATSDE